MNRIELLIRQRPVQVRNRYGQDAVLFDVSWVGFNHEKRLLYSMYFPRAVADFMYSSAKKVNGY